MRLNIMRLSTSISVLFLGWFVILIGVMFWGFNYFPHSGSLAGFEQALANWDGGHFVGIAQAGYQYLYQYAFWPLYPILIHILAGLVGNYYLSAFLINIVCLFWGLDNFYKLLRLDYSPKLSKKAVLLLLIFPTAFFFLAAYSESLFFFLTVSAFLNLRLSQQKKIAVKKRQIYLVLAILSAMLAGLTRLVGLAVILGVLIEIYQTKAWAQKNWLLVASAGAGVLSYSVYLYLKVGNPFYFFIAEQHWQRGLAWPGSGFWLTIQFLSAGQLVANYWQALLDLIFSILGLGLVLRSVRFLRPSYVVYGLASLMVPLFTTSLSSMPRFLLPIFPLFIVLAQVKKTWLIWIYGLISVGLLVFLSISYIDGYWVS